jgi:hypothetical protein
VRVSVVLVSADRSACDLFYKEQQALIPQTLRKHERVRDWGFEFVTSVYNPTSAKVQIQDHVLHVSKKSDLVALLVDTTWQARVSQATKSCFVGHVAFDPQATNYKNLIQATLSKLVKHLALIATHMSKARSRNALLLPLRNFIADEVDGLQDLFGTRALDSDFLVELEGLIERLNARKRPRRRTNDEKTYFIDDQERLFDYGLERHSKVATGDPHTSICVLNGCFRFGWKIPTDQHYNVTKEAGAHTKISGMFLDCHDARAEVRERSHLNMFPNDYYG